MSENKIDLNGVYIPSEKVVARDIEGELIIVPIEDGVADFNDALYSLNETGQLLWGLLDADTTVKTICTTLTAQYNATVETIQADVSEILHKLLDMGIVTKIR